MQAPCRWPGPPRPRLRAVRRPARRPRRHPEVVMCMALAHSLAGFATGAALAVHAGQPAWVASGSAVLATITASGRLSPDVDQYGFWGRPARGLPDEPPRGGGPRQ